MLGIALGVAEGMLPADGAANDQIRLLAQVDVPRRAQANGGLGDGLVAIRTQARVAAFLRDVSLF
nr:hypothetical protein [Pseudomonas kuykendallii]